MEKRLGPVWSACLWCMVGLAILITGSCCGPARTTDVTLSPILPTLQPFGEIIGDQVPVRSGPGHEYDRVGTCGRGDIVKIIEAEGAWYRIKSERFGNDVWIYADFVHPIASLPASSTPSETSEPPLPSLPTATLTPTGAPLLPPPPTATLTPTGTPPPPPTATLTPTGAPLLPPPPTAVPTGTGAPLLPPPSTRTPPST
jgi:hypothetical protein